MKKIILLLALAFSLSACVEDGEPGPQGPAGKDGSSIIFQAGQPAASLGQEGWMYVDTASPNFNVYQKKSGTWTYQGSLKGTVGEAGVNGQNGQNGVDGTIWYYGSNPPLDSIGKEKDYYFNTTTADVYVKGATSWGTPIANTRGQNGADGADGALIIIDNVPPTDGIGVSGDVYFDMSTSNVYQKNGSIWELKGNFRGNDGQDGSDGINGSNGADGTKFLSGSGEPANGETGTGKPGDIYMDLNTKKVYQKGSNHIWTQVGTFAMVPQFNYYFQYGYTNYLDEGMYTNTQDADFIGWFDVSASNQNNGSNYVFGLVNEASNHYHRNSMLYFDVSAVKTHFGVGADCMNEIDVDDAQVHLFVSEMTANPDPNQVISVSVMPSTRPLFVENEITWNQLSSGKSWQYYEADAVPGSSQSGGEGESASVSGNLVYFNRLPREDYVSFRIPREAVKKWICDSNNNKGLLVRTNHYVTGTSGGHDQFVWFYAKEMYGTGGSSGADTYNARLPMLNISVRRKNQTAGGRVGAKERDSKEVIDTFLKLRGLK